MARVYADLVRKGRITLDDVPKKIRADVEAILNAQAAALFSAQEGGGDDGSYLCNPDRKGKENLCAGTG